MKKILWLDDDCGIFKDLCEMVEDYGYRIYYCPSVTEAIELLDNDEHKFSTFILDLNISPDGLSNAELQETNGGILSGLVFYKNYIYPKYKETPAIVFSAINAKHHIDNASIAKNLIHLKKPMDSGSLIDYINKASSQHFV